MTDKVADHITAAPLADIDVDQLSDEDIRQLVIHHATLIRSRHGTYEQQRERSRIATSAWHSWPQPLWERFSTMVLSARETKDAFWARPADTNNKLTPLV
jgi:hypothetical protein